MTPEWEGAARRGSLDVLERLAAAGTDIDALDRYGQTALMLAAINGRTEVVRILVDTGADLGLRGTGAPGFAGKTALDLAIAQGDPEIVDMLRSRGADRTE